MSGVKEFQRASMFQAKQEVLQRTSPDTALSIFQLRQLDGKMLSKLWLIQSANNLRLAALHLLWANLEIGDYVAESTTSLRLVGLYRRVFGTKSMLCAWCLLVLCGIYACQKTPVRKVLSSDKNHLLFARCFRRLRRRDKGPSGSLFGFVYRAWTSRNKWPSARVLSALNIFARVEVRIGCWFYVSAHMMNIMNSEKFLGELKEKICFADWHKRYYQNRARKYHRIDYWLKAGLGVGALAAAVISGFSAWRTTGALIAGGCAFIMANLLPILKWDDIVSGFKAEEAEWIRIFKGYEGILSYYEISNRDEILVQEIQRVKEMQNATALHSRWLPHNKKVLDQCDKETREYYGLPMDPYKSEDKTVI